MPNSIIIGSPDPSFNPIELDVKDCNYFKKEYYDISDLNLSGKLYQYARDIIRGRWLEAEPIIMQNPQWAFRYVSILIKGRWPEAEPHIMKDAKWAYRYAFYIIRGRWPEAEPTIMQDLKYAEAYNHFIKGQKWIQ